MTPRDHYGRPTLLPQSTPTRTPHFCADQGGCAACSRAIDAAEDARLGDGSHDWDMDDRAEREARW